MSRKMTFPREFYIPKSAVKVADKLSDAVAYLSTNSKGKPRATIFVGKQGKPVSDYWYPTEARREASIKYAFENRRERQARKAAEKAKRVAWVPDYEIGEILRTCWGYDQTNVEYFEVTEINGKYLILREIAQETKETGFMQGICAPLPGQYLEPRYAGDDRGQPIRRLAQESGVKIDDVRTGFRCKPQIVGGVKVYRPASWSSYA